MAIKAKDLAKILGLSPASVSLVLNNKPGVSEATRKKVLEALKEYECEDLLPESSNGDKKILFLVYRKNGAKTEASPYFSQIFSDIIEGVEYQVKNSGYKLMITYADRETISAEMEKARDEKIEGLLLLGTEMVDEQMKIFADMHVPTVIIDNYVGSVDIDCVTINNEQGVDVAVSHLVAMGHTEIGYLHVEGNANNFLERYDGFLRSLRRNQLKLDENSIIQFSTNDGGTVYEKIKDRLSEVEKMPTAFFTDNDITAIWAIRVLREMGYSIPEDVSIVGFDNISMSELMEPPLTTIQTPKYAIGCVAVNTLLSKIHGTMQGIQKIELKTSLVERESVKPV